MDNTLLEFALTIGLFIVAMLPLLIDNLRSGRATNRNNLILVLAGIISLVIGHLWGWNQQSLWSTGAWIASGIVVLTVLAIMGILEGGVAKMLIALLPWFTATNYLMVIAVGFILVIPVILMKRRSIPMALPLAIAGIGIMINNFGIHGLV